MDRIRLKNSKIYEKLSIYCQRICISIFKKDRSMGTWLKNGGTERLEDFFKYFEFKKAEI